MQKKKNMRTVPLTFKLWYEKTQGNQSLITVLPTGWFSFGRRRRRRTRVWPPSRRTGNGSIPSIPIPSLLPERSSPPAVPPPPPTHPPSRHIPPDYLARARKQKGDNGQWRNTKGQTQSVSVLDGDEGAAVGRPPSRPPSLHRWRLIPPPHYLYFPNCNERELSITLSA